MSQAIKEIYKCLKLRSERITSSEGLIPFPDQAFSIYQSNSWSILLFELQKINADIAKNIPFKNHIGSLISKLKEK